MGSNIARDWRYEAHPVVARSLEYLVGRRPVGGRCRAISVWLASGCRRPDGQSLVYLSSDGFMAPTITDAEKQARRRKVMDKRKTRQGSKPRLRAVKRFLLLRIASEPRMYIRCTSGALLRI